MIHSWLDAMIEGIQCPMAYAYLTEGFAKVPADAAFLPA
jgi:hypothetical protein